MYAFHDRSIIFHFHPYHTGINTSVANGIKSIVSCIFKCASCLILLLNKMQVHVSKQRRHLLEELEPVIGQYAGAKKSPPSLMLWWASREDRIRTCDPLVPNQVRYRPALLPVSFTEALAKVNNFFVFSSLSLKLRWTKIFQIFLNHLRRGFGG